MNKLQIFNSEEFGEVRTIEIDGKPYFVGTDVAKALGYSNPRKAILDHCKGVTKRDTPTSSGVQSMSYINEGDLYRLIMKSKLPSAEKFETWVFDEVVPSIRTNGGYIVGQETLSDDELMAKAILVAQKKIAERDQLIEEQRQQISVKNQIIGELKPKADYYDEILKNPGLVTITQIAKDYEMSGKKMNDILHDLGIQYKQSGQWLLYDKYSKNGYTHSETVDIVRSDGRRDVKMNTKWKQKGRIFLYNMLKEKGIVPMIEQENAQTRMQEVKM